MIMKSICQNLFFLLLFLVAGSPALPQIVIGGDEPPVTEKREHSLKYFNKTETGISFGIGKFRTDIYNGIQKKIRNDEIVFTLQTINGIRFGDQLGLGVSAGVEKWQNGLFWPLYGFLSYDLKPADNTFYGSVYIGYGIGHRDADSFHEAGDGAFALSIGVGYKQKIAKKLRFIFEAFYKYQAVDSKYNIFTTINDSTTLQTVQDYKTSLHFAGFKIGITFP